jgi:hypothetical protein
MEFYSGLNSMKYHGDNAGLRTLLMSELATVIRESPENFKLVLKKSNVPFNNDSTDEELADVFIDNIGKNKKLLIGSSFLIAHKNKKSSADGTTNIPDNAVSDIAKGIYDCFSGADGVIAGAVSDLSKLAKTAIENNPKNQYRLAEIRKQEAKEQSRDAIKQAIISNKLNSSKKSEMNPTTKKALIISASVVGVAIIGLYQRH